MLATPAPWIRPLPNLLSAARLALAGVLPFLPPHLWLAAILTAGASDVLDGWIARRFRVESWSGGLLDGLADKLFVLSAILTLVGGGRIHLLAALPMLLRDLVVVGIGVRLSLRREWELLRHVPARLLGKLTTILLFATFVLLAASEEPLPGVQALTLATALCSGAAAVDYLMRMQRLGSSSPG